MSKRADKKGKRREAAVVGIKDREVGTIRAIPVPETAAARLVEFVESSIARDTQVFTDGNATYNGLDSHEAVNHGDVECVRGKVRINGAEPFLAPVERGYNGTFHRMEPKHPRRYVNEFAGRLGDAAAGTLERMGNIAQNMVCKRLTYRQLIAGKSSCGSP